MESVSKPQASNKHLVQRSVNNNPSNGAVKKPTNETKNGKHPVNSTPETAVNTKGESDKKSETVDDLKVQLSTLMNSIATLSAEKSRMEANFQADRRQLRAERDENDRTIRDLREKLKRSQQTSHSELEHVKYKLIMERHEREKEQADNSAMIKELQRLVTDERRGRELLEQQLREWKSQAVNKTQNKILEAELEVANQRLKQADAAGKEPPPMLLTLQAEMTSLKKQHRNAIYEERKRAAAAEQQAKALEMAHEARVVSLEARLAELSETVGGYERLRQQDLQAIQKLKEELSKPEKSESKSFLSLEINDPQVIAVKIQELYKQLLDLNNQQDRAVNIEELLRGLNIQEDKEKYEMLQQEFENYKQQTAEKLKSLTDNLSPHEGSPELNLAKSYSKNLEERIRMLNKEANSRENEFKAKLQSFSQQLQEERIKFERMLAQKDTEYRGKIGNLEHQLLRQRERSLALIESKDQEINSLKSSLRTARVHNHYQTSNSTGEQSFISVDKSMEPISDYVSSLVASESPPLLHYAQELARREIQVTGLRKQNSELESKLRENHRELLGITQRHADEIKIFQTKIIRLEAYKSREGANLEYLKNVFVNYLTSADTSSKRHMLNAIATVLKFTPEETKKIQRLE